ncbi:MAG TPA: allantoinase AllB, partial [Gemmatimonadaceae bacterium]|nr:allantoinase AllB [Gemmatimonadaceae bacterium]
QRVVTATGTRAASIHIDDGRIVRVADWNDAEEGASLVDAGNDVVMPGLIDTHVHCDEPGRTEWEGFYCATHAAGAGGITTILDMPLNSIPATTTVAALGEKRVSARGKSAVNVEYIGGVIPGNSTDIERLARAGVLAFKCFLSPSGVDEFPAVAESDLRKAFPILEKTGLPLMVHSEDPTLLLDGPRGGSRRYGDWLASRPAAAERSAIELLVRLMEWCPARVHIVHLSSAQSLDVIRAARAKGLPITVETCPHYLTFAAEEILDGATEFKCAPPIRESAEREGLWAALIAGDIDFVASDHSPCIPIMKQPNGDFFAAWGGIASLQISLSAVWTGARKRGVPFEKIVDWMSVHPARFAGLSKTKASIAEGFDADITIWDPDSKFTVDPVALEHRHAVTPYAWRELYGVVKATYVCGRKVLPGSHN